MSPASNRNTQFDMLPLANVKQPTPPSENARLQDLKAPGRVLQKNVLSRKRPRSPEQDALDTQVEMPKARFRPDESTVTGSLLLRAIWESPWKQYEKTYDLELAGSVEVAIRKAPPIELVHVRRFLKPGVEKALHMFQQLHHPNIVTALDVFTTEEGLYVVLEPMSISLERVVESPAYPNERQLAAILGQVSFQL